MERRKQVTATEFKTPEYMMFWWNKIWQGEYDIRTTVPIKRIVDVGACVGAFSIWAKSRWPEAEVFDCYEPNPKAFALLEQNIAGGNHHMTAVGDRSGVAWLQVPETNIGAAVAWPEKRDGSVEVNMMDASKLPSCDLMKLDCEGAELDILQKYMPDNKPHAVLMEYHSELIASNCQSLMDLYGYRLVKAMEYSEQVGIQCWRKT